MVDTVLCRMQDDALWPCFRNNWQNTGTSTIRANYIGKKPWMFQTGKGIFSTPVIDRDGHIYVGSADHWFYALEPDGSVKWQMKAGELIDSAGVLGYLGDDEIPVVIVPSGDGYLYCLKCETGEIMWKFEAELTPETSYNRWWEANASIGPDGTIYAGNTNFNYYAVRPDGTQKWNYATDSNAWSAAAFSVDDSIIWGSVDSFVHCVNMDGSSKWKKRTLGFISSSAVISQEGVAYIGSFDSSLYALDVENGRTQQKPRDDVARDRRELETHRELAAHESRQQKRPDTEYQVAVQQVPRAYERFKDDVHRGSRAESRA